MGQRFNLAGRLSIVGRLALLIIAPLLLLGVPASAQVGTASIAGTVQDSSGGVIKGAQLTITQTDTGIVHTTASDNDGKFIVPLLPVGSYSVHVEFSGFVTYEQTGVVLTVGQVASVNITLKPGSLNQTVTVAANADIVETQQSNSSTLVAEEQVVGLPLNGRNPATLVFLTGGTTNPVENNLISNTGSPVLQNSLVYPSEIAPTIHGQRGGGVYFSLDGANNNDSYQVTGGPFPNPDATTEFSVVSGNYGAEYVSAPGGAVNIVTKSGTNQVHGDIFEFVRNGIFNARNFFSTTPDELKRNQFGATLGAPIKRDKWFIFGSYQGMRLANHVGGNISFVPSVAERSGNFSQILPKIIKNPANGLPFPGNMITPTATLDPVMQGLLKYIPSSTTPLGAKVIPGAANDEVIWVQPQSQKEDQAVVKTDYIFGNHRILGRYFYTHFVWDPNGVPDGDLLASTQGQNQRWDNVTVGDTWTKGNLISDARFSYIRDNSIVLVGQSSVTLHGLGANVTPGQVPTIQSLGVTGAFSVGSSDYNDFQRHTFDMSEDVSLLHGRHQVSFGVDVQHIHGLLEANSGQNGNASFSGVFSGNALADFILGKTPAFTQADGIAIGATVTLPGFYAQDRIRVTNRLTVTAGLRWDPYFPFEAVNGRIECWQPGVKSRVFINAPTGLTFPGDPGCNSAGGVNTSWGNVQPRIGFAYQLDSAGKTVVRGGYGLYTTQFPVLGFVAFGIIQPFERMVADTNPGPISNPWLGFPGGNPFANGFQLNLGSRPADSPFVPGGTAYTFNPNFKLAYTQQWSLILERALAPNDVIEVSYFGAKGTHLDQVQEDNQAVYVPGTAGAGCAVGQYGTTAVGQPCSTQTNIQLRRPDTLIGSLHGYITGADSFYHGLELEYHHRFQAGLTLSSAFTYSRSIDDLSAPANVILARYNNLIPVPGEPHLRRGPSDFNQPYTWRTSGVWYLPFGKDLTGVAGVLGKGWSLSGIFTRDAGQPLIILTSNTDNSFTGLGVDMANVVPGVPRRVNISDATAALKGLPIINTNAFVVNAPGTPGITGRNAFNTPALTDLDASILKEFLFTERFRFQFRTEFFNALNHPQFYFPAPTTLGTGTFGKLTIARDPRILQFSAKLLF
jgi:hypothetical protein